MVKGEKPYDQADVDAALAQFEDTAKKLPTLFPESTKGLKPDGDFYASPKIWEDKAGFDAKLASFAKAVSEAKAKIKDARQPEGDFPADRQGMRRLPRDLPRQEQLTPVRTQEAAEASMRPIDYVGVRGCTRFGTCRFVVRSLARVLLRHLRCEVTSSPGRGFRRPDWLRCGC